MQATNCADGLLGGQQAMKVLFLVVLVAAIAFSAYFGAQRPATELDAA
jgi:hypothetical protein